MHAVRSNDVASGTPPGPSRTSNEGASHDGGAGVSVRSPRPDVLVVDDDPTALAYLHAILIGAGYSVAMATSGTEALAAANRLQPRLIVLDVRMPDLSGTRVCRALCGERQSPGTPIVFVSSAGSKANRLEGFRSGCVDYVEKPFDPDELLARIGAHYTSADRCVALEHRHAALTSAHAELYADLLAASKLQQSLLPPEPTQDLHPRMAWRCVQRHNLGGDAIRLMRLTPDSFAVCVLDASGHGAPASLVATAGSVLLANATRRAAAKSTAGLLPRPSAILEQVSDALSGVLPDGVFATMLVAIVDLSARTLTYASAGHPGPLLLRSGYEPTFLDEPALPVGLGEAGSYADYIVRAHSNDRIVLYTDGAFEQRSPSHACFGRDRLARVCAARTGDGPGPDLDLLIQTLRAWSGRESFDDDITVWLFDFA